MNIDEIINQINIEKTNKKWPSNFKYLKSKENHPSIHLIDDTSPQDLREFEVWGIAFFDAIRERTGDKTINNLNFSIGQHPVKECEVEALRRRLSYLSINTGIKIYLSCNGEIKPLDNKTELLNRDFEKIPEYIKERNVEIKGQQLEKDLQAFLAGNAMVTRTNDRLAIFGQDFRNIKRKKFFVLREFPTGSFKNEQKENDRILPTNFIDLVTLNNQGKLSLIEIKIDDSRLQVIPQILDYSLFVISHFKQLKKNIITQANRSIREKQRDEPSRITNIKESIVSYLVSNVFHEKFDAVFSYYKPKEDKSFNFKIKVCELGVYRNN